MKTEVREIKISEIVGSLCRMRLEKDYEKEELMASIKRRGVMNPIKIKKTKKGYLLFAGHRRLDSSRGLGLETIPAEIWEEISDEEAVLRGFVDNINRKDFTQLEEGYAYAKLTDDFQHSVEELMKSCGKSRSRIYTLLTLVRNLTPAMKEAIIAGKMTAGHGEWLLRIEDPRLRAWSFRKVLDGKLTLTDLKYQVYRQKPDSEKSYDELQLDVIEDICEKDPGIKSLWKKSVRVSRSLRGIKFTIEVDSLKDLKQKFYIVLKAMEEEPT